MGGVVVQPFVASALAAVRRLSELGEPLPAPIGERLAERQGSETAETLEEVGHLLAPYVLVEMAVQDDGRTLCTPGGAPARLVQHGWRSFLIAVRNPHGIVAPLTGGLPGVIGATIRDTSAKPTLFDRPRESFAGAIAKMWLQTKVQDAGPLSGIPTEYRVVSLYSRDAGTRTADLHFDILEPNVAETPTRGPEFVAWMRNHFESRPYAARIEFDTVPAVDLVLDIREPDGRTSIAGVTVTDALGRCYPSKAMRLAPDLLFQDQVYRAAGEVIRLPAGRYAVSAARGPEYRPVVADIEIGDRDAHLRIDLDHWVDPGAAGYYSGDPHIHGGGCSHYAVPTEGVTPETMIRQVRGEGLRLGSVLTWGPCYYHQKQFFSGESISPVAGLEHPEMQAAQGMTWEPQPSDLDHESHLRYDVEISGFPSSHSGHVILLGLRDQDYPGTQWLEDWPSWNLPIHRWAAAQGAMTGYAHAGNGMSVGTDELPNYLIPPFAGVGANELIVDVPLGSAEFLAGAQFSPASEMNAWYHLLNAGFETLMVGETDFPCVYNEGPGVGRTYVRLAAPPSGADALEQWIEGLRTNPSYFGDGRSHLFDVAVDGDTTRRQQRAAPGPVTITATAAAWLPEELPTPVTTGGSRFSAPRGWHLERDRIGETRRVPVELIVDGIAVDRREIEADGSPTRVEFRHELTGSSWVTLRIRASVHSQPIFVTVAGEPVRASRRSAEWLRDCVDALWAEKRPFIRDAELDDARAAYDEARAVYAARVIESREGT